MTDSVGTPLHAVESRRSHPIFHKGKHITDIAERVLYAATLAGDWDALPVIVADGSARIALRARAVYSDGIGLWGCATCEQWHPNTVVVCPLVTRLSHAVILGPIHHDGDQVLYVRAVVATEPY